MARLLIIDDDDLLRGVLAKSLTHAGHTVLQAPDGRQGVELTRVTPVDIVITDLIMPVQEGVETILTLRREQPALPVIAMSGGASNSKLYLEIAEKIGARRILAKPFTPKQLLEVIDEILAEQAAAEE
ncbi:MAG TPA: response regulator [Opitutaceae bacterium]|nr:response regulator [Opitutaceae bacterium]